MKYLGKMTSRKIGVHSFKWLILIEVDIFAYLVFKDLKAVITVVYHCVLRCIQACDVELKMRHQIQQSVVVIISILDQF